MEFNIRMKLRDITVLSRKLLQRDLDGPTCDMLWEYRRILGKFNLFKKSTRLDIAYIVHQCGRFPGNPISIHKNAILTIGRYLMKTSDRGMVLRPVHQDYKEVWWIAMNKAITWQSQWKFRAGRELSQHLQFRTSLAGVKSAEVKNEDAK